MAATYINQDVINTYEKAGICPPYPRKLVKAIANNDGCDCKIDLKTAIKRQLRIIDEEDAVGRYVAYNIPCDLSSLELERLLYYRSQLCCFFFKEIGEWQFMPYTLMDELDYFGRYKYVKPIPVFDATEKSSDTVKKNYARQSALLSTYKLRVLYDVPTEPLDPNEDYCVLLCDYTKQLSETLIPRQQLQDPLLDVMADCIPFMRTALLNSTGVQGMRVSSEDEQSNVKAASKSLDRAALSGDKWIPIVGALEFQDLTSAGVARGEEFLMAMQSLDNFRLSTYGLQNGGLFEKKQYQNTAQTALNGNGAVGSPLQNGLLIRQRFCDILNSISGAGMSYEISEQAAGTDLNMDGLAANDNDQSGIPGDQPQEVSEDV